MHAKPAVQCSLFGLLCSEVCLACFGQIDLAYFNTCEFPHVWHQKCCNASKACAVKPVWISHNPEDFLRIIKQDVSRGPIHERSQKDELHSVSRYQHHIVISSSSKQMPRDGPRRRGVASQIRLVGLLARHVVWLVEVCQPDTQSGWHRTVGHVVWLAERLLVRQMQWRQRLGGPAGGAYLAKGTFRSRCWASTTTLRWCRQLGIETKPSRCRQLHLSGPDLCLIVF